MDPFSLGGSWKGLATARVAAPTVALALCVAGVVWSGVSQSVWGVGAFAGPGVLAALVLGLRLREQRRGRTDRVA